MVELFANSGDPDQTPLSVASDQGLHCLPSTRLGVSSLQWVKRKVYSHCINKEKKKKKKMTRLFVAFVYFMISFCFISDHHSDGNFQ